MNLYLDSSALLKLYIVELGSRDTRSLIRSATLIASSLVTWPEAVAGLARAHRGGRLSKAEYGVSTSQLIELWSGTWVIDLSRDVANDAGDLAAQYFLKGLDAIHLASASRLQDELGDPVTFSAFDDRLNDAARAEGLIVP